MGWSAARKEEFLTRLAEVLEVGAFKPLMMKVAGLEAGEVGYIATGLKSVGECRVGDTITLARNGAAEPLPGYGAQKPMVFAGLYPTEGVDFHELREALERLQMNDASLTFEPENSAALGPGLARGGSGSRHQRLTRHHDIMPDEHQDQEDLKPAHPLEEFSIILVDGH